MWELNFGDVLKLRSHSAHVKCNICVRYKLMIRKLARSSMAKEQQIKLLDKHREQQYVDRVCYWHSRNIARTLSGCSAPATVVVICDSMDCAKYSWPRDHSLRAKEFNRFIAPKLTATAGIAHGHDVFVALSVPGLPSDSSRTVEILARILERFRERGQDLGSTELLLQGDNGPKEIKNNCVLRYLSMLVAHNKIKRAEVRTLMSGHTHEDVDAFFACLSAVLKQGGQCLHTPMDYARVLQQYLHRDDVRPKEPHSEVILMDQVRDWNLSFIEPIDFSMSTDLVYGDNNLSGGTLTTAACHLRKTFFALHFQNNTISGIGGPSAPHTFALDRVCDLGAISVTLCDVCFRICWQVWCASLC